MHRLGNESSEKGVDANVDMFQGRFISLALTNRYTSIVYEMYVQLKLCVHCVDRSERSSTYSDQVDREEYQIMLHLSVH
jgi:hypothetical protein